MEIQNLTVRFPVDDAVFLKKYARNYGITVTEALHRYLYRMRELARANIYPEYPNSPAWHLLTWMPKKSTAST